jgi:hypothetical protein
MQTAESVAYARHKNLKFLQKAAYIMDERG